jgi:hypothetical protein
MGRRLAWNVAGLVAVLMLLCLLLGFMAPVPSRGSARLYWVLTSPWSLVCAPVLFVCSITPAAFLFEPESLAILFALNPLFFAGLTFGLTRMAASDAVRGYTIVECGPKAVAVRERHALRCRVWSCAVLALTTIWFFSVSALLGSLLRGIVGSHLFGQHPAYGLLSWGTAIPVLRARSHVWIGLSWSRLVCEALACTGLACAAVFALKRTLIYRRFQVWSAQT